MSTPGSMLPLVRKRRAQASAAAAAAPGLDSTQQCKQPKAALPPTLLVTPQNHDFNNTAIDGNPVMQQFRLANIGDADLHITGAIIPPNPNNEFAISAHSPVHHATGWTLAHGQEVQVTVSFTPTTVPQRLATLRIASNDPGDAVNGGVRDVAITGTGQFAAPRIDFLVNNALSTIVRIGLWDNAWEEVVTVTQRGQRQVRTVQNVFHNEQAENRNFIGRDSRAFSIRVTDREAVARGANTVTVQWWTRRVDRDNGNAEEDDDHPAVADLTLERVGGTFDYLSKKVMLVTDDDDAAQATHTGLAHGAAVARGAANHRLRRVSVADRYGLDGSVRVSYVHQCAPYASPAVSNATVFGRAAGDRRRIRVHLMKVVTAGQYATVAAAADATAADAAATAAATLAAAAVAVASPAAIAAAQVAAARAAVAATAKAAALVAVNAAVAAAGTAGAAAAATAAAQAVTDSDADLTRYKEAIQAIYGRIGIFAQVERGVVTAPGVCTGWAGRITDGADPAVVVAVQEHSRNPAHIVPHPTQTALIDAAQVQAGETYLFFVANIFDPLTESHAGGEAFYASQAAPPGNPAASLPDLDLQLRAQELALLLHAARQGLVQAEVDEIDALLEAARADASNASGDNMVVQARAFWDTVEAQRASNLPQWLSAIIATRQQAALQQTFGAAFVNEMTAAQGCAFLVPHDLLLSDMAPAHELTHIMTNLNNAADGHFDLGDPARVPVLDASNNEIPGFVEGKNLMNRFQLFAGLPTGVNVPKRLWDHPATNAHRNNMQIPAQVTAILANNTFVANY